jgi:serine/threonine protein kinase
MGTVDLAQDTSREGALDRPVWDGRQPPPLPRLAPGTLVGSYRVDAVLGEGGMGVVYRALDTKFNRVIAVKFLSDDLDAAARYRFQREAQMVSSLNHPHILTVHDAGEFEGRQYLVAEYVDGGTLSDWARREKPTWRHHRGAHQSVLPVPESHGLGQR